ncbi:uncharacterized [Tachysurus ichikawai]
MSTRAPRRVPCRFFLPVLCSAALRVQSTVDGLPETQNSPTALNVNRGHQKRLLFFMARLVLETILLFKHLRNASMQPACQSESTPLSCSISRDLNPSVCFLCESPLSQACIINVSSDLPALSKCNQHRGTHTTCFLVFCSHAVRSRPQLLLFSVALSGNQGHGAVEDVEDALPPRLHKRVAEPSYGTSEGLTVNRWRINVVRNDSKGVSQYQECEERTFW